MNQMQSTAPTTNAINPNAINPNAINPNTGVAILAGATSGAVGGALIGLAFGIGGASDAGIMATIPVTIFAMGFVAAFGVALALIPGVAISVALQRFGLTQAAPYIGAVFGTIAGLATHVILGAGTWFFGHEFAFISFCLSGLIGGAAGGLVLARQTVQ